MANNKIFADYINGLKQFPDPLITEILNNSSNNVYIGPAIPAYTDSAKIIEIDYVESDISYYVIYENGLENAALDNTFDFEKLESLEKYLIKNPKNLPRWIGPENKKPKYSEVEWVGDGIDDFDEWECFPYSTNEKLHTVNINYTGKFEYVGNGQWRQFKTEKLGDKI